MTAEASPAPPQHASRPQYPFGRPSPLDPSPLYAEFRSGCPVSTVAVPSGDRGYLVSTYDEVRAVLSDPAFSRAATLEPGAPRVAAAPQRFKSLLNMDPPEHGRVRRLVSREFTARRVATLEPRIQEIADALLDAMREQGPPVDLVQEFAVSLPVAVICELLGVPVADRGLFTGWSAAFLSTTQLPAAEVLAAQGALRDYMAALVASKRAEPGGDLLSALVGVRDRDDGSLDEEELIFLGVSLLVAGHETTANQISNSVFALLTRHRELRGAFAAGQPAGSAQRVVDELLRLYPPGDEALPRITLADTVLGGTPVPAGSLVLPSICSANRDADRFAAPDAAHPDRPANPHLTFGHGAHYCLGSGLARAELLIALGSLLRRFPALRLAGSADGVRRAEGRLVHGVSELRVAW